MVKRSLVVLSVLFLMLVSSPFVPGAISASQEETIVGMVVQHGKVFVIEADEEDYIVKGKDLSKLVGKMVEATGTIIESEKGDTIEVKTVEEVEE